MELIGFCTADSYRIKPLFDHLIKKYDAELSRDVIWVNLQEAAVFIFPFGVVVSWGLKKGDAVKLMKEFRDFEVGHLAKFESDEFAYQIGEAPKIASDLLTLPNVDPLTKLAISHGIAQSIELAYFETVIQKSFDTTRKIPEDLAKRGKISLSRGEIRKKMGELFCERSSVNLHADVLDLPEFFWDHPELEPLYQMVANYLDIRARVEVLNRRLDIIHELYEVLANELNHQHSSRLELTIILLIVIEVFVSLMRDVFRLI
jgi:uncharacterized Rmd1/YagE family protein